MFNSTHLKLNGSRHQWFACSFLVYPLLPPLYPIQSIAFIHSFIIFNNLRVRSFFLKIVWKIFSSSSSSFLHQNEKDEVWITIKTVNKFFFVCLFANSKKAWCTTITAWLYCNIKQNEKKNDRWKNTFGYIGWQENIEALALKLCAKNSNNENAPIIRPYFLFCLKESASFIDYWLSINNYHK